MTLKEADELLRSFGWEVWDGDRRLGPRTVPDDTMGEFIINDDGEDFFVDRAGERWAVRIRLKFGVVAFHFRFDTKEEADVAITTIKLLRSVS